MKWSNLCRREVGMPTQRGRLAGRRQVDETLQSNSATRVRPPPARTSPNRSILESVGCLSLDFCSGLGASWHPPAAALKASIASQLLVDVPKSMCQTTEAWSMPFPASQRSISARCPASFWPEYRTNARENRRSFCETRFVHNQVSNNEHDPASLVIVIRRRASMMTSVTSPAVPCDVS